MLEKSTPDNEIKDEEKKVAGREKLKETNQQKDDLFEGIQRMIDFVGNEFVGHIKKKNVLMEAEKYQQIASSDLRSAEHNYENGSYSQSVYASHQAAEKSLKALLFYKGALSDYLKRNHKVVLLARRVTENWGSHEELVVFATQMEALGLDESTSNKKSSLSVRARYPAFEKGHLIDLPDLVFTSDEADEAASLAFRIFAIGDLLLQREEDRIKVKKQLFKDMCKSLFSDMVKFADLSEIFNDFERRVFTYYLNM